VSSHKDWLLRHNVVYDSNGLKLKDLYSKYPFKVLKSWKRAQVYFKLGAQVPGENNGSTTIYRNLSNKTPAADPQSVGMLRENLDQIRY
jgi:hypothetical protein